MPFLSDISKGMKRTTQKARVQFGKAEKTVDTEFDTAYGRYKAHKSHTEKVFRDMKSFLDSIRKMTKCLDESSQSLSAYYQPSDGPITTTGLSNQVSDASKKITHAVSQELESEVMSKCINPLESYTRELAQIHKRVEDRNRLLIDMDRYNLDLHKRQAKATGPADEALQQLETKARTTSDAYRVANTDLIHDMNALCDHRDHRLNPLLSVFLKAHSRFLTMIAGEFTTLSEEADRQGLHAVVASPRMSASHSNLPPAPGPPAAAAATPAPHAAPYGGAPPAHQGYGAPPAHQGYGAPPAQPAYGAPSYGQPEYGAPPYGQPEYGAPPHTTAPASAAAPTGFGIVKAMYDFNAEEANELSFPAGAVITLTAAPDGSEWYQGTYEGRTGLLPAAYVQFQ